MSRVKVFYFIPHLEQGGAERQILALINALPERFEPVLCVASGEIHYRDELPPGQPRHVLGVREMGLRSLLQLVRILEQERPAIFHSYRDKANFWGRIAALRAGVPVIISSCRSRMMELQHLAVERTLAARCQLVIVNSEGTRRELQTLAGVPAARIRVVHNFLDLEHFRPPTAAERRAARTRFELGDERRVLVIPARLSLQKHQLGTLLALQHLVEQGRAGGALLLLAGRARDARIAQLVQRAAARPALRERVRLLGAVREIRALYWAADALLLPSLYEGLPNAALEGCACGLPAVLSTAANADGIIAHGEGGFEVRTAHRGDLVAALAALLEASPAALAAMGRRARARVAERFAAARVRGEMLQIYDGLLAAAGGAR